MESLFLKNISFLILGMFFPKSLETFFFLKKQVLEKALNFKVSFL